MHVAVYCSISIYIRYFREFICGIRSRVRIRMTRSSSSSSSRHDSRHRRKTERHNALQRRHLRRSSSRSLSRSRDRRNKHSKPRHRGRSRRRRCGHNSRDCSWCCSREKDYRNKNQGCMHYPRHEDSGRKTSEDEESKHSYRNRRYGHDGSYCSRCRCKTFRGYSRYDSHSSDYLGDAEEKHKGKELARKYHNRRTKKRCSSFKQHRYHHCQRRHFSPTSLESRSTFYKEGMPSQLKNDNSSSVAGLNCRDQAPVMPAKSVPDSSAGKERDPDKGQNLIGAVLVNPKTSEEMKCSVLTDGRVWPELSSKHTEMGGHERDWLRLSLNISKASKPMLEDIDGKDFKLGLPGYSLFGIAKGKNDIDLNVAMEAEEEWMEKSTPMQLPTQLSCFLSEVQPSSPLVSNQNMKSPVEGQVNKVMIDTYCAGEFQNNAKATQSAKKSYQLALACQVGTEIIVLDDSDAADTDIGKRRCSEGHGLNMNHGGQILGKDGGLSVEFLAPGTNADEEASEGISRSASFVEGKLIDAGPMHVNDQDYKIPCIPDEVNWLDGEGEERESSENSGQNQSKHSTVLTDDVPSLKRKQDFITPNGYQGHITQGFKARKKRMVHKRPLPVRDSAGIGDKELVPGTVIGGTVIVQKAFLNKIVIAKPRMWDAGICCDLCRQGPSLSLGEWYAWCCGSRLFNCNCSPEYQMKLKSLLRIRKSNKSKKNEELSWSGKVHKMCGLWSSEVFEEDDEGDRLKGLLDAVRRGRSLLCAAPGCRELGATLGCRVKNCRRSFHYPCADRLASQLRCRMWDGVQFPVACHGHRHVEQSCQSAKEKAPDLKKWRYRGCITVKGSKQKQNMTSGKLSDREQSIWDQQNSITEDRFDSSKVGTSKRRREEVHNMHMPLPESEFFECGHGKGFSFESGKHDECLTQIAFVIDLSSENEDIKEGKKCITSKAAEISGSNNVMEEESTSGDFFETVSTGDPFCNQGLGEFQETCTVFGADNHKFQSGAQSFQQERHEDRTCDLYYMGVNLLCMDISGGCEAVMIPCTNDVDADPAPDIKYITQSRYLGRAKSILDSLLLDGQNLAKSCEGCNYFDIDDPHEEISVHVGVKNRRRDSDGRNDWQGQPMLGRLPYDHCGRLQLGPETNDVIECNSRCRCGSKCLNRELQKGLQIPLEVFKTKDRGWGVRTMEQIPRGKFVVEYVGEILTHAEADERGVNYDMSHFSCLFSADHPEVPPEDRLVVDGFKMSNVARFINHSCEGNLRIYRVYTDTTDLKFCRIGMYAARDIEIGEELSYDYKYSNCRDRDKTDFSRDPTAIKCFCGTKSCRLWLWTGAA